MTGDGVVGPGVRHQIKECGPTRKSESCGHLAIGARRRIRQPILNAPIILAIDEGGSLRVGVQGGVQRDRSRIAGRPAQVVDHFLDGRKILRAERARDSRGDVAGIAGRDLRIVHEVLVQEIRRGLIDADLNPTRSPVELHSSLQRVDPRREQTSPARHGSPGTGKHRLGALKSPCHRPGTPAGGGTGQESIPGVHRRRAEP